MTVSARRVRFLVAAVAAVPLATTLAACSGTAHATPATSSPALPSASPTNGRSARGGTPPGTFGTIAAASAGQLEVQNTNGQTTVTYTSSTPLSRTVASSLAVVTPGVCVAATVAGGGSSNAATFTALTVQIAAESNGTCAALGDGGGAGNGAGGNGGGTPAASGTARPAADSGASPSPSRSRRSTGAGFPGRAVGTVQSVSGDSFVVAVPARGQQSARTITVTTTSSTTFTATQAATPADLVVGQCASAAGSANGSGTVAASRIMVSPPGSSGCTAPFRGRRGGATTGG